jgi:two-component system nitrate/nitrite response regulator NarL
VRDPTNMTLSRTAAATEVTSAFLVTNDAIVGDWFERAGHTLAFRVCGRATSMTEAELMIPASGASVLVIDHDLADGSGLELVRNLRGAGVMTPMLVMTAMPVAGLNEGAERAGATGTVVRSGRADDVAWAISAVSRHRTIWDERNPALALASPRELEVLSMIAAGYLTSDIAARLVLSSETIKSHVQNVLLKFGAHTRAEAVAIAVRAGVV